LRQSYFIRTDAKETFKSTRLDVPILPSSYSFMGEFDLIKKYFTRPTRRAVLGVGDDCALLQLAPGMQLATSTDMLVEGRHFFPSVSPALLGHKALAVNLSDLAACGAQPLAFTLALALPLVNETFLAEFSKGLLGLADEHGCELIGGDTTCGPLNLCITGFGEVPEGQALRRSGAQVNDDIYVSGPLGDARLALEVLRGQVSMNPDDLKALRPALERPQARVRLGVALRGLAHSAIDLSDGLTGDLNHILRSSGVSARVNVDAIPRSRLLQAQSLERQREYTLAGGDDYELLFTAPPRMRQAIQALAQTEGLQISHVGEIVASAEPGTLHLHDRLGHKLAVPWRAFDHFETQDSD
jgi:thiamine-monophosphate kinase